MPTRRTIVRTAVLGSVGVGGCLERVPGGDDASEDEAESEGGDAAGDGDGSGDPAVAIDLPGVDRGESIPRKYTCDGDDVSPAVDAAGDAEALALVLDDPDAPPGTFTHWTVWNLEPGTDLPEGVERDPEPSELDGARQGENDFDEVGYRGPCPPEGDDPHEYRFTLYGLASALDVDPGASVEPVREGIDDESIGSAEFTATYGR